MRGITGLVVVLNLRRFRHGANYRRSPGMRPTRRGSNPERRRSRFRVCWRSLVPGDRRSRAAGGTGDAGVHHFLGVLPPDFCGSPFF